MKELKENISRSWVYIKDLKKEIAIFLFLQLLSIIVSVVLPILSAKAIVYLTENKLEQLIYISCIVYIIENIVNFIHYYSDKSSQIIYRKSLNKIQMDLGKSILGLQNSTIDENSSGVFIQRITGDAASLADIFNTITYTLSELLSNLGIFGAIFIINKAIFVYTLICIIIMFIMQNLKTKKYNEKDKEYRQTNEKTTGFIGELVRGVRDIKMLNSESSFINSLNRKIMAGNQKKYDASKIRRKYSLIIGSFRDLSDLILIILLVYFINKDSLAVASAIVLKNYYSRLPDITYWFGQSLDELKNFNLSSSRIFSIMNDSEFKREKFGKKHIDKVKGDFEFKNVHFSYSNSKKILQGMNFKINANETVAFVGRSGAGKSTIFSLLCKMYDIEKGEITIDGININELDKDSIRGNITIISQNPYIFNLSIKENLKLVKEDITDEEIKDVCKTACLDDFINELPDKYDTLIGEGGVNLSGGQKQRLAIARALAQKTEIILFDEATSSLDNKTQDKIQQAISNMKGEYTILIIAHRLSTVINSDRILIIDDGKVVSEGTHKELLKNSKVYKELYKSEIKK